jgi:hypothetical protein
MKKEEKEEEVKLSGYKDLVEEMISAILPVL